MYQAPATAKNIATTSWRGDIEQSL